MTFKFFFILVYIPLLSGCISLENSNPDEHKKKALQEARILFAGDVMLDWGIKDIIVKEGIDYPLKHIKQFLNTFDYRFCNLECPVSDKGEVHPEKKYVFLGNPEHIALLKFAGINGVSLANNHACDYGEAALLDTIENLAKNGINVAGAGKDMKAARLPLTIIVNDIRLAVIAYTNIAYDASFAGKDTPGIAMARIDLIKDDIEQYKSFYDFIIVSIHWGNEYFEYPAETEIKLAHQIIDSGADAIIGHHPHIFQGIEIYERKPIFYSIGNFIFGSVNEDVRDNILVEISFFKNRLKSFTVFPINANGDKKKPFQYKLLDGSRAINRLNYLVNISKPLKFKSDFPQKAVIKESSLVYSF